ncbi:hypothetical protein PVAP13_3KG384500 [Panicum virgatum]|uniref:Uncharacterized protein n=1 Tax=Panicum virgatum TaxID=38727 RepID=A0A8T0V385_PANVG|nr:hypothetical protein PVAP13_3KG384500 [Panicum virgatum]
MNTEDDTATRSTGFIASTSYLHVSASSGWLEAPPAP